MVRCLFHEGQRREKRSSNSGVTKPNPHPHSPESTLNNPVFCLDNPGHLTDNGMPNGRNRKDRAVSV